MRAQAQLDRLRQEIAENAKRVGMDVNLHISSDKMIRREPPPTVEWWDEILLTNGRYEDLDLIDEDSSGRVIGESTLTQMPAGKASGEGQTKNPRERVVLADLPARTDGKEFIARKTDKGWPRVWRVK